MILAANWKMNLGVGESDKLARAIVRTVKSSRAHERSIILCPSFSALDRVGRVLRNTPLTLGAQDVFFESSGAYTGEVSPGELVELGCRFVIVGHSERRVLLGETDAMVNKKLHAAIAAGLTPILCVGEPLAVRRAGHQALYVQKQVTSALVGLRRPRILVAYEPIWAIGTGRADTPASAAAMSRVIRKAAGNVPVLYGGSVKPDNARAYLTTRGIHGALVGGASQKIETFRALLAAVA